MKSFLILLCSSLLLFTSCQDPEKDEDLKQRELTLVAKEKDFAAKEQEFEKLRMMRDSLQSLPDSAIIPQIPAGILGRWNGKMICTESNCSEHVIGDVRSDIWVFSQDSVKIINKSGGERMYTSQIEGADIKLNTERSLTPNKKSEITLQLPTEFADRMKGNREIVRENCTSKFSVDLEKIKN